MTSGLAVGSGSSLSCNGPKLFPPDACDSLSKKSDHDFLLIDIAIYLIDDSLELHPERSDSLRKWSTELYTKYDIRSYSDTAIRKPVPADSQLDWDYLYVQIRKSELAGLLTERFIGSVHLTFLPHPLSILPVRMDKALLSEWKAEADVRGHIYYLPEKKSAHGITFKIPKR
jgi:hypothetical protein